MSLSVYLLYIWRKTDNFAVFVTCAAGGAAKAVEIRGKKSVKNMLLCIKGMRFILAWLKTSDFHGIHKIKMSGRPKLICVNMTNR